MVFAMPSTVVYHPRSASALLTSTRSARCVSSVSHLTPSELRLYCERLEAKTRLKTRLPLRRTLQKLPARRLLRPQIYHPQSSTWVPFERSVGGGLERGSVLKAISWNIDWFGPDPAARASAVLGYLKELFGDVSDPLVIMFQELRRESL